MPTFVTTGCMVACCYSRGVYPVRAGVPRDASAVRIGGGLRFRRVTSLYGIPVSRVEDLGPRCGGRVVPNRDGSCALHLPRGTIDSFVSHRSAVCTRHTNRLFGGQHAITVESSDSTSGEENDSTGTNDNAPACCGVGGKSALKTVTTGCNMHMGSLRG